MSIVSQGIMDSYEPSPFHDEILMGSSLYRSGVSIRNPTGVCICSMFQNTAGMSNPEDTFLYVALRLIPPSFPNLLMKWSMSLGGSDKLSHLAWSFCHLLFSALMSLCIENLPQKEVSLRFLGATLMCEYKHECLEGNFTYLFCKMTVVVYPLLPTISPVTKHYQVYSTKNECSTVDWA